MGNRKLQTLCLSEAGSGRARARCKWQPLEEGAELPGPLRLFMPLLACLQIRPPAQTLPYLFRQAQGRDQLIYTMRENVS